MVRRIDRNLQASGIIVNTSLMNYRKLIVNATSFTTSGYSSQLMLHPANQVTLSSILLSSVQGYTQSTPSPPPGLAPIDKQPNGVPDCNKGPCTLNGHVKVGPFYILYAALL